MLAFLSRFSICVNIGIGAYFRIPTIRKEVRNHCTCYFQMYHIRVPTEISQARVHKSLQMRMRDMGINYEVS